MTNALVRQPATADDAITLIHRITRTTDTADQRDAHALPLLHRLFDRGQRRPDLVWFTGEPDTPTGVVSARTFGESEGLIDILVLPDDPESNTALLDDVNTWATSLDEIEISLYGDPEHGHPDVPTLLAHGWQTLVDRHHYAIPATELGASSGHLELHQASGQDEERVHRLVRRALEGSLDVHDRLAISEHGLDAAATEQTQYLLDADPIESIRFLPSPDRDDALVSWRTLDDGRGYVLQVYVDPAARGRGLAARLVDHATGALISEGATQLIADTDHSNMPMARAFAAAGWHPTSTRHDLVPNRPTSADNDSATPPATPAPHPAPPATP